MSRTPEQIEADEQLRAAIGQACRAYGLEDGDHVTDLVVVVSVISLDCDDPASASFFLLTAGAQEHAARGLLHVGLSIMGSNFDRQERGD